MPGEGEAGRRGSLRIRRRALLGAIAVTTVMDLASSASLLLADATTGTEAADRTRVGVALSGGGARGLAHIGVLQWLEEHRIPIDCVAGTSMGGLLAGATAVGLSADSLRQVVLGIDWERLFSASATYDQLALRRKEDTRLCPVRFEMGLRWGPKLPSGLNPGPQVMLLLSSIALPGSDIQNFDDLPIPFRCVATDLATGTPVVLGSGSLAVALRATMAIPGVFDPVSLDGRLLADGGLVDNVPVDVVRGMGADVVVAIDVHGVSRDSVPETLLDVLQSALEIPVQANAQAQLARADVVVRCDPRNFRTTDYASSVAVIEEGYHAAAKYASQLLPLALEPAAWEAHLATRRPPPASVPEIPAFLVVEGVPRPEAEWIARGLEHHAGRAFDRALLERDLDRLVGTGRYASAGYEWAASDSGRGLRVRTREKPYGPPTVRFGIEAGNERDDVTLTIAARTTLIDATSRGSEVRIDVAVGTAPRIAAELFQPLGRPGLATRSEFFVAPRGFVRRDRQDFYTGEERIAATRRTYSGAGADAGWIGGTRFQLRAGYEIRAVDEDIQTGTLPEPEAAGREQLGRLQVVYEGQDAATIPRRGPFLDAEACWYLETPGATTDFGRGAVAIGMAIPSRANDRTLVALEGDLVFGGGEAPLALEPTLGGLLRLSAFQPDELRGRHTAVARLAHLVAIARLGGLTGDRLYAAAAAEFGSAFEDIDQARGFVSGSLGLVADTAIGPCAFGASLGSEGHWRIHFTVGRSLR